MEECVNYRSRKCRNVPSLVSDPTPESLGEVGVHLGEDSGANEVLDKVAEAADGEAGGRRPGSPPSKPRNSVCISFSISASKSASPTEGWHTTFCS